MREFVDYTESLVVGDPLDPATDVGADASAAQRAKVAAQVDGAVASGAQLVTGGAAEGAGYFYSPAVVTGAPAETDLLREETFGPVAPIVPVKALDEAIDLANGTRFGLGRERLHARLRDDRSLHARDQGGDRLVQRPVDRQRRRAVRRLQAVGPGSGARSGGLEAFQETKHVHIDTALEEKEWWYPYG